MPFVISPGQNDQNSHTAAGVAHFISFGCYSTYCQIMTDNVCYIVFISSR